MASKERIWHPSPSPMESWSDASGANEDGEWPVKAVVGEELRLDGTSRYEVRWVNWQRRDGSNTTWETEKFDGSEFLRRWNRKQKRMRVTIADLSSDMDVAWPDDAVHKRLTDQRRQAYEEKLEKKRRAGPASAADWDAQIEAAYRRLQEPEIGEANSRLRLRRVNPMSASGSSASASALSKRRSSPASTLPSHDLSISVGPPSKRNRGRPRFRSPPSSPPSRSASTATPKTATRKGKVAATPTSAGSSKEVETTRKVLPSVIISQLTLRSRISSMWNRAAREVMAATIRISSDISDDDIPRSIRVFKYMEKGYHFRDKELQDTFNASRSVFTRCDCTTCDETSDCSCRDLSEVYDLDLEGKFSVYSKGLFTFEMPRGFDVIECNKYCGCSRRCGNRVVQHPRAIGLEIFDTKRYGWGVRALEDIPRGKVLGTYTGTLIRRNEVDGLPEEHHAYMFDLDSTEVLDSMNLGQKYTVDCYEYGNWTRFVNHSCSPNMKVYCVVYDTIAYVNMPYVAFVASKDILAGTELTIDYYPHADESKNNKGKRSANGGDCRCSSSECRGWIRA